MLEQIVVWTGDEQVVTLKRGTIAYARDYKEPVKILKVERKANGILHATYTIQRANGETTINYPGYLLEVGTK